jgi:pyrroline-5-carboxylate reductase
MTESEAIRRLDEIAATLASDPEAAHSEADAVLLATVPQTVADAYQRVVDACPWWAYA